MIGHRGVVGPPARTRSPPTDFSFTLAPRTRVTDGQIQGAATRSPIRETEYGPQTGYPDFPGYPQPDCSWLQVMPFQL